jgi:hypothetical protein
MTKNTVPRCGVNPTSQPASPKYRIFDAGAIAVRSQPSSPERTRR